MPPPPGRPLCRFFRSSTGCKEGTSCPFLHVAKRRPSRSARKGRGLRREKEEAAAAAHARSVQLRQGGVVSATLRTGAGGVLRPRTPGTEPKQAYYYQRRMPYQPHQPSGLRRECPTACLLGHGSGGAWMPPLPEEGGFSDEDSYDSGEGVVGTSALFSDEDFTSSSSESEAVCTTQIIRPPRGSSAAAGFDAMMAARGGMGLGGVGGGAVWWGRRLL